MKTALMIAMALTVAALSGCASSRGGSLSSDEGFKIAGGPIFATKVKQGDRQTVTVSLERDKYFKQDVTLEATVTSGIRVEPSKVVVKASDSPDVQFQITAPQDAALGEYLLHIAATPETGAPTSKDFTVKVVGP
ncbi:MAG TPA: hypothetical protein VM238_15750 [Phycisphaerae bacterium]|nr:hypothetical protein [Phycisphaerae bacterium]